MDSFLTAVQKTPLPTILILAGLLFLLLGLVSKVGGIIEVSPEHKRWAFPIGALILAIGLALQLFSGSSLPADKPPLATGGGTPTASEPRPPEQPKEKDAAPKPPTQTGPPTGRVAIMNVHSQLCLGIVDEGRERNQEIAQYSCDETPARVWKFTEVSGDTLKIRNENSQLCLTVAGGNTFNNTVSVQYLCDSDASRRWRYSMVEGSRVRLINLNSGLCLTVAGGGTDKNTRAVQYPCDGDPARDWIIRPVQ